MNIHGKAVGKLTIALLSVVTLGLSAGNVVAGNNAEKKANAGFDCFEGPPPNLWTHCWRVKDFSEPAIAVKVYSEDGAEFLGTELLIREDLYGGQPCPQDGGEWAHIEGLGYYACHHFHTGHH